VLLEQLIKVAVAVAAVQLTEAVAVVVLLMQELTVVLILRVVQDNRQTLRDQM
jgi:hypothetical protein